MERLIALADVSKTLHVSSTQLMYEISAARSLLLSQIKLTLCTRELEAKRTTEQEWMINLSVLCGAIHLYNSKVLPVVNWAWCTDHVTREPATRSTKVALADVCDALVTSHARKISQKLLGAFLKPGVIRESFRHLCDQEGNVIWVLIATLARHTSLLEQQAHAHSQNSKHESNVSLDSVATIARGRWTEHRQLAVQLEGRVWKEVAIHLKNISRNSPQISEEMEKELHQFAIG